MKPLTWTQRLADLLFLSLGTPSLPSLIRRRPDSQKLRRALALSRIEKEIAWLEMPNTFFLRGKGMALELFHKLPAQHSRMISRRKKKSCQAQDTINALRILDRMETPSTTRPWAASSQPRIDEHPFVNNLSINCPMLDILGMGSESLDTALRLADEYA